MASGIHAQPISQALLRHANEKLTHADWVAQRITQLGRSPNFDPNGLATRAHVESREGAETEEMIQEDLVTEGMAIETYARIVRWLADEDPTTRRMIEDILEMEEEHADDLANMLVSLHAE